jgi:transcriptional regulator with XRE-family HTH domain
MGMNEPTLNPELELAGKIARLVQEKGWNQEDFARISGLNRQTIRQILQPTGERNLRNSTVAACAQALGMTVHELRTLPLERLLNRLGEPSPADGEDHLLRLHGHTSQPELRAWAERNPERARRLTADEVGELLTLQGALTAFGVESFVTQLERRRALLEQVRVIAGTEYLDLLEQLVGLIYDKVRPQRDRI